MSYDTEEQQVERLKEWWNENGTPLIVGAILGLGGFAGWKYWTQQQVNYQQSASDLYNKVSEVLKSSDKASLVESAEAVKSGYPDSAYAALAAFHLAQAAVEAKELDKAAGELNWVIKANISPEFVATAKIRLARILIEQEKAEQALLLLSFEADDAYYSLASLIKGDALTSLGRNEEALQAYQAASSNLSIAARNATLQLKIDQLSAVDHQPVIEEILKESN